MVCCRSRDRYSWGSLGSSDLVDNVSNILVVIQASDLFVHIGNKHNSAEVDDQYDDVGKASPHDLLDLRRADSNKYGSLCDDSRTE